MHCSIEKFIYKLGYTLFGGRYGVNDVVASHPPPRLKEGDF